ncbi:MAG TPA: DUF389 domain-containing protein [Gammaproteobacteria bacterium]|nr:DUF389 domain-containing protein [Gammaproteobacteria bacterium]
MKTAPRSAARSHPARRSGAQATQIMIHLQILAPAKLTPRTLELLGDSKFVTSVAFLHGAGQKPKGDVILCNVAGEEASNIIADLRDLGIERDGSITIGPEATELSGQIPEAEDDSHTFDAVVWEEVEERTSESAELSGSFVLFMIIAVIIAAVGIYLSSAILIIGAMIVGPDFGPIAGVCVAAVHRRFREAGKSLLALFVGYALGIMAAYLMTLVLRDTGFIPQYFNAMNGSVQALIAQPGFLPVLIALLAGIVGMLSLTTAKSGALIGVLVSVTTIPAAANIAVTVAYAQAGMLRASILQLATNVGAMLLVGIITLAIQRALYRRRRAAHLWELARWEAGPKH